MKLLLTSGGVTNETIRAELERLMGRSIEEAHALIIPTAQWGHPMCGPESARGSVAGVSPWGGLVSLGWASVGLLELTALASIGADRWVPWVHAADVLLVDGGEATYLAHWMRESGLADLIPDLADTVWVGVSAGSMALTPRIGSEFVDWAGARDDATLGVVDFALFPHLDVFPTNTMAEAERWAGAIGCASFVLDDDSAVVVEEGLVRVVSEGSWRRFTGDAAAERHAE